MPKIVDHDARRREIIAIARRLIAEGGFRAATMRSLAAEAGYANGALKHYFDSKDQIIEATFDSVLDELDALESTIGQADMSAFLHLRLSMMAPVATPGAGDAAGSRVLLALADYALESPRLHERYQRHLAHWRDGFVRTMIAARDEGSIRGDANYADIADEYLAMAVGSAVMSLMYPNGEKSHVFVGYIENTLTSLSNRPGSPSPTYETLAGATPEEPELEQAFFAPLSATTDVHEPDIRPAHRHDVMFSNSLSGDE